MPSTLDRILQLINRDLWAVRATADREKLENPRDLGRRTSVVPDPHPSKRRRDSSDAHSPTQSEETQAHQCPRSCPTHLAAGCNVLVACESRLPCWSGPKQSQPKKRLRLAPLPMVLALEASLQDPAIDAWLCRRLRRKWMSRSGQMTIVVDNSSRGPTEVNHREGLVKLKYCLIDLITEFSRAVAASSPRRSRSRAVSSSMSTISSRFVCWY
jgi:hypothetical protein